MAHGVDAPVEAMQAAPSDPRPDLVGGEPRRVQLLEGEDAVPAPGQRRYLHVRRVWVTFSVSTPGFVTHTPIVRGRALRDKALVCRLRYRPSSSP
jgi:hypothetical protein